MCYINYWFDYDTVFDGEVWHSGSGTWCWCACKYGLPGKVKPVLVLFAIKTTVNSIV